MIDFEETVISDFRPKWVKDRETGEQFGLLIFKGELQIKKSSQISELFDNFRKQLINLKFTSYDENTDDIIFSDVHLEDFTVKTKMVLIGRGKEVERIPVEMVKFKMSMKMDSEGEYLKKLYAIFMKTVKMQIL